MVIQAKQMAGDWWCPSCKEALPWNRVTYQERCDTCGAAVVWVPAEGPSYEELRAAAEALPDLLAACEALLPYLATEEQTLDYASLNEGSANGWHVASLQARAAIAKARRAGQ